jgi:hypothetical protein
MMDLPLLLAEDMSLGGRLAVGAIIVVVGSVLIMAGWKNVKTQEAEETGSRRAVNSLLNSLARIWDG